MVETVVDVLVEGGKASAGPPLGPALGPLGINIGDVVKAINDKTKPFQGMQVPVKVIVDTGTKEFRIEVGSPPTSALIKKELGLEKGGNDQKNKIGNVSPEQVVKIAKMKIDNMLSQNLKSATKEVIGTCLSMGVTVDGKDPKEAQAEIDEGKWDNLFK